MTTGSSDEIASWASWADLANHCGAGAPFPFNCGYRAITSMFVWPPTRKTAPPSAWPRRHWAAKMFSSNCPGSPLGFWNCLINSERTASAVFLVLLSPDRCIVARSNSLDITSPSVEFYSSLSRIRRLANKAHRLNVFSLGTIRQALLELILQIHLLCQGARKPSQGQLGENTHSRWKLIQACLHCKTCMIIG